MRLNPREEPLKAISLGRAFDRSRHSAKNTVKTSPGNQLANTELKKLPYVRRLPSDGRAVPIYAYYDDAENDWHSYFATREGELRRLAGGELVTGTYLSNSPAEPDRDFEIPLGTFVIRHLSFPKVVPAVSEFANDVSHLSAVLEKYHMISAIRQHRSIEAGLLAASETEYLLMLVRSTYDVLQTVCRETAEFVRSRGSNRRAFQPLPTSFARVVLAGLRLRSRDEIKDKFGLTGALASFYATQGPSFKLVRDLRDDMVHRRRELPWIFRLEEGLATSVDEPPWSRLPLWTPALIRNKRLGSLRAVFAYLTRNVLEAAASFMAAFGSSVGVRPALDPDVRMYLRGPFTHRLLRLDDLLANPWEGESEEAQSNPATA